MYDLKCVTHVQRTPYIVKEALHQTPEEEEEMQKDTAGE